MSKSKLTIRSIYLYLVTLIGLMMIVIPSVDLIKISLETWVFPLAGENEWESYPPEPYMLRESMDSDYKADVGSTTPQMTAEQQESFRDWQQDYNSWKKNKESGKIANIRRQKSIVRDISTLIVGLILFLTHGNIVRKEKDSEETKKKKTKK